MNSGYEQLCIKKNPSAEDRWVLYAVRGDSLFSNLFDSGFLARKPSEIVNARTTHFTFLVHLNFLKCRHIYWKNTFNTNCARHFTNGKGLGSTASSALNYDAFEKLSTRFFTFFDFVVYGDGVTRRKFREFFFSDKFAFYKLD